MSSKGVIRFLQNNVVLITGIGIIVATHWAWSKLQENPRLVPEEKRKDMPVVLGLQYMSKSLLNKVTSLTAAETDGNKSFEDKE